MKPVLSKGQLTTWKDDRGFGFIQLSDGSQEVFLHISAFKELNRRESSKTSYQIEFRIIVILHLVFWLVWLLFNKTLINLFLSIL
ncbi:cold shock domain-containing protein [Nodularia spumigena]|jgi:cold shock CspA family protein|uniref:CSD domain-containing protein n=2 Tax=Nodularia spumigena TaxID=70799 RepID=A0A2S0QAJ6_NODSP|nr:cold shock domain-containing protein [Nodularia spumigena]AVZ31384.1 hypothetical protein BMF81_04072 [Nodularia spumigena UHCC 0039]MEA5526134.1 cold shock domain-containing protein [Nodularia spumigena UHCC 0143]MEA5557234.1 cold shock domain-containing protein [Nodularia spumigena CH309]MEA5608979.1 cold shock domain-containing protein [Nodularia spumigena UHCC 0060]MEA5615864.1 cold shock domain-containing protein [Nodularia spumigena UHCC 0040]